MSKKWGIVIDQERCIGCEACSVACRIENSSDIFWIKVETKGGDLKDTPEGKFPNLKIEFLPRLCNHCLYPPCVDSCPEKALVKRDDGPVILSKELCNGCQVCVSACPYNVIAFNKETNTIEKCNLCIHRIDQALEPFCVVCCEGQAIHFGDLNDPKSQVSILISNREHFQLKPEDGTEPSIYYCTPKPKKGL